MLTDTEARELLHQAAETIEVGPAAPFAASPRRSPLVVIAAAVAVCLVIVTGLVAWRAHRPAPVDRPGGGVTVPSVFGYPVGAAVEALRARGLTPRVKQKASCVDSGRALRTNPAAGTALPVGSRVVVMSASNRAVRCPLVPANVARDHAWLLVDLALGVSPPPVFADHVVLSVNDQPPASVSGSAAMSPAGWPACDDAEPRCPGTALEVIRDAVEHPLTTTRGHPLPRALSISTMSRNGSSFSFSIGYALNGPELGPRWSIAEKLDEAGAVTAVHLDFRGTARHDAAGTGSRLVVTGQDPGGIGQRFADFATGRSPTLPIDTPVRLYRGHHYVRTLSADLASDPHAWTVCGPGHLGATCRLSTVETLASYAESGHGLRASPPPTGGDPGFCLNAGGEAPTDTGGDHVIALRPYPVGCIGTFEVDIYSNDVGEIVAVDLLRGRRA